MTDNTRRGYLQGLATLSLTGAATRVASTGTDSDPKPHIAARDLVLSDTAVPNRFEKYSEMASGRFLDTLYVEAPGLSVADTASTGYWHGGTRDNPHWVISSLALVVDDPLPRGTVEDATRMSTEAYVEEYDAETNPFIEFEFSHARGRRASDWRVDIIDTSGLHTSTDGDSPIFADLMRHQFFGNVLLSTVVFGPRDDPPALAAMLDEYAKHQRIRYRTHGGRR